MYGILILVIGLLIRNTILIAIGLALFVDELPYLIIKGNSHKDNYSPYSLVGLMVCMLIVYFWTIISV